MSDVVRCANPGCGLPIQRQATGRPAQYCGPTCRQAARRKRVRAEAAAQFRDANTARAVTKPRSGTPAWDAVRAEAAAQFRDANAARAVTKPRRMQGTPAWDAVRNTNVRQSNRQVAVRRAAAELLRVLNHVSGPDDPDTQLALRDVVTAVRRRRDS